MSACSRVVCAVEPSPTGLDVLERVRRFVAPGGTLVAVTVVDPADWSGSGWEGADTPSDLWARAEEIHLEAGRRLASAPGQRAVLREGVPVTAILQELELQRADLLAVGAHGHGRIEGIVRGSVSTALVHRAPCPVLLVRPVGPPFRFPRTVVAGVDGSAPSLEALRVARELARRLGVPLRPVVAGGGKPVDVEGLVHVEPLEWLDEEPVEALTRVVGPEDLAVVGSRGLHGLGALGSVSERVAHRAPGSVLVVRPTAAGRPMETRAPAGAEAAR